MVIRAPGKGWVTYPKLDDSTCTQTYFFRRIWIWRGNDNSWSVCLHTAEYSSREGHVTCSKWNDLYVIGWFLKTFLALFCTFSNQYLEFANNPHFLHTLGCVSYVCLKIAGMIPLYWSKQYKLCDLAISGQQLHIILQSMLDHDSYT